MKKEGAVLSIQSQHFLYLYIMLDYLIVGLGLAGISFCETLEKNGKSFKVISDDSQTSSIVAGGLYNPVILKRFTLAWKAGEQLDEALPFYKALADKLNIQLDYKVPVLRRFASIEEQNVWFEAADKPSLRPFLSTAIISNQNPNIHAPFGYGKVLNTGRITTEKLLQAYSKYLLDNTRLCEETFHFDSLKITPDYISYKSYKAKRIVFATGFGVKKNPYFNYLPLNGTKGELLTIRAVDLKESNIIKSSVFSIPLGEDLYRIGATYNWKDKTNIPTREARAELLEKLDTFLKCKYEVIQHVAGIRPTVADRRPLVGRHPEYKHMYILNGFGSRGVMTAPYASNQLYDFIAHQTPLPPEMDIVRFSKKYFKN